MAVRAVLFDRDGVLTNFDLAAASRFFAPLTPLSVFALAARWQAMGEREGFPRSLAEEQKLFARFWAQIAGEFALSPEQQAELAAVDYTRFVVGYAEAAPVLQALHRQGLRLGVLSNFSLASLEQSLAGAGLAHYFDSMCAAPVIGCSKPDARAYTIALESLGVTADECLYFDDEEECVEGARQVGMDAFLVSRHATADDWSRRLVASLHRVPELASSYSR